MTELHVWWFVDCVVSESGVHSLSHSSEKAQNLRTLFWSILGGFIMQKRQISNFMLWICLIGILKTGNDKFAAAEKANCYSHFSLLYTNSNVSFTSECPLQYHANWSIDCSQIDVLFFIFSTNKTVQLDNHIFISMHIFKIPPVLDLFMKRLYDLHS